MERSGNESLKLHSLRHDLENGSNNGRMEDLEMMQIFMRDGRKWKRIIETDCDMIWKMGPILESNKG